MAWQSGGGMSPRVLLSDVLLGAPQASIDLPGIPQGYSSLELLGLFRSDFAPFSPNLNVTVNGDSGAHYDTQRLGGSVVTADAGSAGAGTKADLFAVPGSGAAPGLVTSVRLHVFGYGDTTHVQQLHVEAYRIDAAGANNMALNLFMVVWEQVAAINRLTFTVAFGNLEVPSHVRLYGVA